MKTRNVRKRQWRRWMRRWFQLAPLPVTDLVYPAACMRLDGGSEFHIKAVRAALASRD